MANASLTQSLTVFVINLLQLTFLPKIKVDWTLCAGKWAHSTSFFLLVVSGNWSSLALLSQWGLIIIVVFVVDVVLVDIIHSPVRPGECWSPTLLHSLRLRLINPANIRGIDPQRAQTRRSLAVRAACVSVCLPIVRQWSGMLWTATWTCVYLYSSQMYKWEREREREEKTIFFFFDNTQMSMSMISCVVFD